MTGRRFEAVIFDFGGVFTTSPIENFAGFERKHRLPQRFIGGVIKLNHHTNAWARYERAEIAIEEFDRLFAEESRAAGFEIAGRTLVSLLGLSFRPEMIEAHARIKAAGLKTGCITNNLPKIDSKDMIADASRRGEVDAIFARFNCVIESSKFGARKPEPRIYEMMVDALGVTASACVFLDDLGINLKPARDMGMATIKVPFGDVAPAIDELSALLALPLR